MKRIKKELNKWQFVFSYEDSWEYIDKKMFRFGILNIHTFPEIGDPFSKKHYKGFFLNRSFTRPLTLLRKYLQKKGY